MPFTYASFDVDLTDRDKCLEFVGTALEAWGLDLPADADLQLELTAGKDGEGTVVYRPYAYQSEVLATAVNTTHLNRGSAGPVSGDFRDADKTIAAWLEGVIN